MGRQEDLASIVGLENVVDDPEVIEKYSKDYSFVTPRKPSHVVFPGKVEEIQEVVRYANDRLIPLVPRSSEVGFYGAGVPSQGGIILMLSRMNRILEVDAKNKKVKVEPGVTWEQVQTELEKHGLMVCNPLLPHPKKSVLTTCVEREPMLIWKSEYGDPFLTAEMVLADGSMFWSGTAIAKGMVGQCFPDAFIPGSRIFSGAQGMLGIMTWANLKAEYLPTTDKLFFVSFEKDEDIAEPIYRIGRRMLGNECFVLNSFNLAALLAQSWPDDFIKLKETLPPWTLILCLSGLNRHPEEKIAYEEEALMEIASELHFDALRTVSSGVPGLEGKIQKLLRKPWAEDKYWKFLYKGACHDIFFHTTLDRVPEFNKAIDFVAAKHGYPTKDIGFYLQPIERGRACCCQYGFSCDPDDTKDVELVHNLYLEASELVISMGGYIATPYGLWADMVFKRTSSYVPTMKLVKDAFDPNNILNPGKLSL